MLLIWNEFHDLWLDRFFHTGLPLGKVMGRDFSPWVYRYVRKGGFGGREVWWRSG